MGLSGAAFGASQSLEDIVAQRVLAQKLQEEIALRQEQSSRDQQRIDESSKQNAWERSRAEKMDAEKALERKQAADNDATDRRGLSNMAGVMSMGLDPQTAKREIAFSARDPKLMMQAMEPEKVTRHTVTTNVGGKPVRKLVTEDELAGGIEEYREPKAGPQPDYEWVVGRDGSPRQIRKGTAQPGDRPYERSTNPQGADPAKAEQTRQSMLDTAKSLRKHPGLGNLTGARIGNPDYGLGVLDEPAGGSQAADAKPFYDRLKALFTVDNIGLLKGVLSDSDMKILASVGTSLDTKMTDPTFAAELDQIIQKLEGSGNAPAPTVVDPRVAELIKKYGGGQ